MPSIYHGPVIFTDVLFTTWHFFTDVQYLIDQHLRVWMVWYICVKWTCEWIAGYSITLKRWWHCSSSSSVHTCMFVQWESIFTRLFYLVKKTKSSIPHKNQLYGMLMWPLEKEIMWPAWKIRPCECKLQWVVFLLISSVSNVVRIYFCKLQKKVH